jgi:hypothetical protein
MKNVAKTGTLFALGLSLVLGSCLPGIASPAGREARFDRNHPRRSEVLDRKNNLNRKINANRGNLDGHYGQLKHEDRSIRRQEQRDARMNGGHITRGEQAHLNREENHLNRQIKHDETH